MRGHRWLSLHRPMIARIIGHSGTIWKSDIKTASLLGAKNYRTTLTRLEYAASALAPINFHVAMESGKPHAKRVKREHHSTRQHHSHPHFSKKRVDVIRSPKYKLNGTASYLYAVRKYNFNPP
jgi:hypothetical protein